MNFNRIVVVIIAAVLLTACAKGQPAIALPTATYTVVPPTATITATAVPTATGTDSNLYRNGDGNRDSNIDFYTNPNAIVDAQSNGDSHRHNETIADADFAVLPLDQ